MVTKQKIAEQIPGGPDPEPILAALQKYKEAGFDCVSLHQVGLNQTGFFQFYQGAIAKI